MPTQPKINKYYLGKNELIHCIDKHLANIMRGLLHVDGQLLESRILPVWEDANLIILRVGVPEGLEREFEKYTGLTLTSI